MGGVLGGVLEAFQCVGELAAVREDQTELIVLIDRRGIDRKGAFADVRGLPGVARLSIRIRTMHYAPSEQPARGIRRWRIRNVPSSD